MSGPDFVDPVGGREADKLLFLKWAVYMISVGDDFEWYMLTHPGAAAESDVLLRMGGVR